MAKKSGDVNKSAAVRDLLRENPRIKAKEAIAVLGEKGVEIKSSLFYFVKGRMRGSKSRRQKRQQMAAKVSATTGNGNPVGTILRVKALAHEVGGLKNLKALVDVLAE